MTSKLITPVLYMTVCSSLILTQANALHATQAIVRTVTSVVMKVDSLKTAHVFRNIGVR
jgi:hypothetical protein